MIHGGDMNERIKELAEQAGFQYIKDEGIGWAGNYNDSLPKFAELLINECKNAFWTDECNTSDLAMAFFRRNVKKIEQHFGIIL